MSSPPSDPKSNYHFHREAGDLTVREHLRQYQADKMKRIVAANANSPAGVAIRRASESGMSKGKKGQPDGAALLPPKAHWTTEERWAAEHPENQESDLENDVFEEQQRGDWSEVARRESTGEAQGVKEDAKEKKEKGRRGSVKQRIKDAAMKAATGYTSQKKEGMYPI